MANLELDTAGDLLVTNNALTIVEGDAAIRQHLSTRLQFFKGEWPMDQRLGVPYYEYVLVKNPDLSLVRSIFRKAILDTPGIDTLEEFTLSYDNPSRVLGLSFTAKKTDGDLLDYSKEFII
jgi:hypothetical protein